MRGSIVLRILFAIVLIAVTVGLGVWIYNAGVAQGMAAGADAGAAPSGPGVYPYGGPFFHPWGFGFFPFGLLFPLLWIFIIFGLLRALFFRPWHGYGRGPWGWRHFGEGPRDVPPMVEEWHRKMHGEPTDPTK